MDGLDTTLQALGVSRRELARRMGISHNNVQNWINGKKRATPASIRRVALALGVPVSSITRPIVYVEQDLAELVTTVANGAAITEAVQSANPLDAVTVLIAKTVRESASAITASALCRYADMLDAGAEDPSETDAVRPGLERAASLLRVAASNIAMQAAVRSQNSDDAAT